MPVIPTYTNQVGVANGALSAQGPTVFRQDKTLETVSEIAVAVAQGAQLYQKVDEQRTKREAVNLLSQNTFDETYFTAKQQAAANGDGFVDNIREGYAAYRDGVLQRTEDPGVRRLLADHLDAQAPKYIGAAAKEQYAMRSAYDTDQTNQAISSLQNGVMSNPMNYETNLALGRQVIENAPVDQASKGKMARALAENLASTRFDGMIARAKTPTDIESIKADFAQKDWTGSMKPTDYERIAKQLEEKKNSLGSRLDAEGEAFLAATKDRTKDYAALDTQTRAELSALVRRAPGTKNSIKAAQVLRNQEFLDQNGGKSLPELRQTVEGLRTVAQQPSAVPPRVMQAVSAAAAAGSGSISTAYLLATAQAEYGGELAKGSGYDVVNKGSDGAGTSTGLYQFSDKTWLSLLKDGRTADRFGVDIEGKSDQELLALRASPEMSAKMTVALAEQDKAYLERAFGRDINDNELYMAHFLGAPDAVKFLSAYQTTPYAPADAVVPEAASANAPLFPKGATLKDVYDNISHLFGTSNAAIAYNDLNYAEGLLAKADKAAKDGTLIEYYIERHQGEQVVQPLDLNNPVSFSERGVLAEKLSKMNSFPVARIKPFLPGEVDAIVQTLEEGGAEQKLALLSNMSRLGGAMEKGLSQLGDKEPVLGYVAQLAASSNANQQVALDTLKGRERLQKDKTAKALLGDDRYRIGVFSEVAGEALSGLSPDDMASIRAAADAHYVERNRTGSVDSVGVMSNSPSVNDGLYAKSIEAVLANRLGEFNGRKTILPQSVSSEDVSRFFNTVSRFELEQLNVPPPGVPASGPVDYKGDPVSLYAIANEGKLVANGANNYKILTDDGKPLQMRVAQRPDGSWQTKDYLIKLDKESVDRVNARGVLTPPEKALWFIEGLKAVKG